MKIIFFANTDWYLYNFRRTLALALRNKGYEVLLVSPPGPYVKKLQKLGLRWLSVSLSRSGLNPFLELATVWKLSKIMRQENANLAHGFTIKGAVYCSLAARLSGISARVNSIDGLGYVFASRDFKARILRPLVRLILRLALASKNTRLILQNSDDIALFRQFDLIADSHMHLIPGAGVDCRRFSIGGKRVVGQPLRVLLAARLLWSKGLAEFVDAARLLKAEGRHVTFLLAGSIDPGNPDSLSIETLQGWVSEGLIDWLGHVDDMAGLLATVHVVTLPTAYREGLPSSLTEGAACGLPLVTTNMPGCRDVVTHELDGLLVPIGNAMALSLAIARLDDDPVLASRLGVAARIKALENFDENIVIKQTMEIYSELLGM